MHLTPFIPTQSRSSRRVSPSPSSAAICAAILLAAGSAAQDELRIEAEELQGQAGTEVLARDAVLSYREITLRAARVLYDTQAGWAKASGGVRITDGDGNALETDLLDYFPQLGRAVAEGGVRFSSSEGMSLVAHLIRFEIDQQGVYLEGGGRLTDGRGNEIAAAEMSYLVRERTGTATDAVLRGAGTPGVITASMLSIGPEGYSLEDAAYTTCKADDPAWVLRAGEIEVDGGNRVVARDATLRLFDVPVFYLPTMTFNLSKERRSGFLTPKTSFRSGGEVNVEIPFYLNLAPNYDAVVSPRIINERGILTNVQGRWLFPASSGTGGVNFIKDEVAERERWAWNVDNTAEVGSGSRLDIAGEWVSDDLFADDFFEGTATAKRHYEQRVALSREAGDGEYGLELLHHRTVDDADPDVTRPFDSLPSAWASWSSERDDYGISVDGRYDMFVRGSDDPQEGFRVHSSAELGRTDWLGGSRLDSEAGLAGSVYGHGDAKWVVPYASLQLRHPLEGELELGGDSYRQVVEPRLMVGVVGKESFDGVPLYDTARTDLNASDIYSVNPFVGGDRFSDANLVVYGIEARMWDSGSDREVFSTRVAQRYRLEDSSVAVGSEQAPEEGPSNLVAEGSIRPTRETALKARVEWDPDVSDLEQLDIEAQRLFTGGNAVAVRYARNAVEGSDEDEGHAGLRIVRNLSGNWRFASDVSYDIEESEVSEVFGGLSYVSSCRCWGIDFYAEREAVSQGNRTTYFFQISLEGLGGFGSDRLSDVIDDIRQPL